MREKYEHLFQLRLSHCEEKAKSGDDEMVKSSFIFCCREQLRGMLQLMWHCGAITVTEENSENKRIDREFSYEKFLVNDK